MMMGFRYSKRGMADYDGHALVKTKGRLRVIHCWLSETDEEMRWGGDSVPAQQS